MKKNEIKVGGVYTAKVSGKLTTVMVTAIRKRMSGYGPRAREVTVFDVTNLSTGRKTTFASAMKFRAVARREDRARAFYAQSSIPSKDREAAEQPSDPTGSAKGKSSGSGTLVQERRLKMTPTSDSTTASSTQGSSMETPTELALNNSPTLALNDPPKMALTAKIYDDRQQSLTDRLRKARDTGVDHSPHVIVEARAGTGKTTTLIEGLKRVKGLPSTLIPSSQQAKVWESMEQSKGKAQTICFVAFNKSIATELQSRVPQGCDAMTMHSLGFKAVQKTFGRVQVNSYRVQDIISELLERDIRELRRTKPEVIKATEELVGLCKMNLVGVDQYTHEENEGYQQSLSDLASYYDVDLNGHSAEVFDLVPRVLERCKDVARDGCINFDDMIWLPVALGLNVYRYDLLLVDEAQDLNRCQQALAKMAGRRLILCGDPKQAIYGFAGADAQSMSRLEQELSATERGCVHLPLTVTRRCGKAIVAEANRVVPDFEAFETNPEGKVSYFCLRVKDDVTKPHTEQLDYHTVIQDGDMILCRCNAPLVSECFQLIRAGRKANIQGRDVGQGLIKTVQKLMKSSLPIKTETGGTGDYDTLSYEIETLRRRLDDWLHAEERKERAKRNSSEQRLVNLQDRRDCLLCFTEGTRTTDEVIKKIERIFTDDKSSAGIRLSSVHKAKGLEARRVFILVPKESPMPHPMAKTAWEKEQELNIKYVAITRAVEELIWVS